MKIMSFSQMGPRAICILSANGVISSVTLRQSDSYGGTLTYEVCYFQFLETQRYLCSEQSMMIWHIMHICDFCLDSIIYIAHTQQ